MGGTVDGSAGRGPRRFGVLRVLLQQLGPMLGLSAGHEVRAVLGPAADGDVAHGIVRLLVEGPALPSMSPGARELMEFPAYRWPDGWTSFPAGMTGDVRPRPDRASPGIEPTAPGFDVLSAAPSSQSLGDLLGASGAGSKAKGRSRWARLVPRFASGSAATRRDLAHGATVRGVRCDGGHSGAGPVAVGRGVLPGASAAEATGVRCAVDGENRELLVWRALPEGGRHEASPLGAGCGGPTAGWRGCRGARRWSTPTTERFVPQEYRLRGVGWRPYGYSGMCGGLGCYPGQLAGSAWDAWNGWDDGAAGVCVCGDWLGGGAWPAAIAAWGVHVGRECGDVDGGGPHG